MAWLNGDRDQAPLPFALSLADSYAGILLTEGILACLFRRIETNRGGCVRVSLLEALLDLQFEVLATYLNDGRRRPERAAYHNAHAYLSAPYGIYETRGGYIALAMGSLSELAKILKLPELSAYETGGQSFEKRDEIKRMIGSRLKERRTEDWLPELERAGYWASDVYNWEQLMARPEFSELDFILKTQRSGCEPLYTTRCPIRVDGRILKSGKPAPRLGEDTLRTAKEFDLLKRKAGVG